jgi:hypothetical protein
VLYHFPAKADIVSALAEPFLADFETAVAPGDRAGFAEKVRAAQAITMLSDPVIIYADAALDELRAAVLSGVRALYASSPTSRQVRS